MLKIINSRQSVRAWTEKKVAVSMIKKILEAGMNAPSAGNEHALKLGGVWTGIYPQAGRVRVFRRLLKLPKSVVPLALVPFGYPAVPLKKRPSRYKQSRVHFNSW